MSQDATQAKPAKQVEVVSGITVRLAGDSGDGMQLLGTQLTNTSALSGNDVATFPGRACAGTLRPASDQIALLQDTLLPFIAI